MTVSNEKIEEMLARPVKQRTPTIEEWYGKDHALSFPDDDGEEMRRVSSTTYVIEVRLDELAEILTELRDLRAKENTNG